MKARHVLRALAGSLVASCATGPVAPPNGVERTSGGLVKAGVISKGPSRLCNGLTGIRGHATSRLCRSSIRSDSRTSHGYNVYPHEKVPERMFSNSELAIQVANLPAIAIQVDNGKPCEKPGQFTQCARDLLQAGLQTETAYQIRLTKMQGRLQVCKGDLGRCQLNLREVSRPTSITIDDEGSTVMLVVVGIVAGVVGVASGVAIGYGLPKK